MWKLFAFAIMVAAGQLLFKRTADGASKVTGIEAVMRHILFDPWFIIALCLYVAATILWIFALREMPLSRAYPFMALAFVLVPAGAVFFFGETVGLRYFFGLALVIAGISIIATPSRTDGEISKQLASRPRAQG